MSAVKTEKSPEVLNLQFLADRLGVSRSTVSRALRNDSRIAEATRARVSEMARKVGYVQNPYLSVLMHNLRDGMLPKIAPVIAFVDTDEEGQRPADLAARRRVLEGVSGKARALGFSLEGFRVGVEGVNSKRLRDILEARGIRAVLYYRKLPAAFAECLSEGFASVALNLDSSDDIVNQVSTDCIEDTKTAICSLRAKGYRKIGLVLNADENSRAARLSRMAFLEYEYNLCPKDKVGIWSGAPSGVDSFEDWIAEGEPDILLLLGDLTAERSSYLGTDFLRGIGLARLVDGSRQSILGGVEPSLEVVGAEAVELVVALIKSNDFSAPKVGKNVLVKGSWRESALNCGKAVGDDRQRCKVSSKEYLSVGV